MPLKINKIDWPHFEERPKECSVKYLVIHCFAFPIQKNLELWQKLGVGSHYLIDEKGNISQLVDENRIAWHAGASFWRGQNSLNITSIGIELYSPSFGQKAYPPEQLNAFVKLAKALIKRYHILPENIVGHSDIAPTRKVDPGKAFPWAEMAKHGIGLWPTTRKNISVRGSVITMLRRIGYDVTDAKAALYAFLRHFVPEKVALEKQDIFSMETTLPEHIKKYAVCDRDVLERLIIVSSGYPLWKKHKS